MPATNLQGMEREEYRIRTMTENQLAARIGRIKSPDKMRLFALALSKAGYTDLAARAYEQYEEVLKPREEAGTLPRLPFSTRDDTRDGGSFEEGATVTGTTSGRTTVVGEAPNAVEEERPMRGTRPRYGWLRTIVLGGMEFEARDAPAIEGAAQELALATGWSRVEAINQVVGVLRQYIDSGFSVSDLNVAEVVMEKLHETVERAFEQHGKQKMPGPPKDPNQVRVIRTGRKKS